MKEKIIYQEKYRKGAMMVKKELLPRLKHTPERLIVQSVEIQAVGVIEIDGVRMQFQDVRILMKESDVG